MRRSDSTTSARQALALTVHCASGGRTIALVTTHLSASGMRVAGLAELPLHQALTWKLVITDGVEPVALPGTITSADDDAFEVEFTDAPEIVRTLFREALIAAFPHTVQAARLREDGRASVAGARSKHVSSMLSVVVPVYNEGELVEQFHAELCASLSELGLAHEIIYVDDGSRDDTILRLRSIADASTRVVSLTRNFGHQAAVLAGMEASRGAAVVTIDGDLQQPPSLIHKLVERWQDGYDIVNTIRRADKQLGLIKRLTSRWFYALLSLLSTINVPSGAADFRLLDHEVVDILLSFRERHFFLRGLAHWIGFRATYLEYSPAARRAGESKFTFTKMLRLAGDGFFSFSAFPLRLVFYMGLLSLGVTFGVVLYVTYAQVLHLQVPGWSSLLLILSFFSGLHMLGLGVVAEYVGRIFTEVKLRPRYLTKSEIRAEDVVFRSLAELVAVPRG